MSKCLTRALFLACAAATVSALYADDADNGLWRPAPPVKEHPYPRLKPREPRPPARLASMTLDGTFASYKQGAAANGLQDVKGNGTVFGAGTVQHQQGPNGGACILNPGGNGPTIGFEEKNIPFKPNTWYRIEYMIKGIPYMMQFTYPREAPAPGGGTEYMNTVIIDNSFGGGYGFCYVCSECKFVKHGGEGDGSWITYGFNELPDTCPKCGAKDSLYNEGGRQAYPDWTLVYADFRVNDYVGYFHNVPYYWLLVIIGSGADNRYANLMVYEIDGEGGEPVGGDLVVDIPADSVLAPPRVAPLEVRFPAPLGDKPVRAAAAEFQKARRFVAAELGLPLPPTRIVKKTGVEAGTASILVNGETVWAGPFAGEADAPALGAKMAAALRANARHLLTLDDTALLADAARKAGKTIDLPLPEIHGALRGLLAAGRPIHPFPELAE